MDLRRAPPDGCFFRIRIISNAARLDGGGDRIREIKWNGISCIHGLPEREDGFTRSGALGDDFLVRSRLIHVRFG